MGENYYNCIDCGELCRRVNPKQKRCAYCQERHEKDMKNARRREKYWAEKETKPKKEKPPKTEKTEKKKLFVPNKDATPKVTRESFGLKEHECFLCGKKFECFPQYIYRRRPSKPDRTVYFCSYTCMRKFDKEQERTG